MYQSSTPAAFMASIHSGFRPLPLRTLSMMVKDRLGSTPIWIRYSMISSRVQMAVEMVALPSLMKRWALFSHTSVPWDRPEIRMRSEKDWGLASTTIWITKSVPNSGMPRQPKGQPSISSGLIPRASVFLNRDMTFGSSRGIVLASMPVRSSSMRIMVGSSCPRMSSFSRLWSMEW